MTIKKLREPPSARWTSFDDWRYDDMDKRLQQALDGIDKNALVQHAGRLMNREFTLSEPFSAGQYWVCFEMVARNDGGLVIARVRLPPHPEASPAASQEKEDHAIACELATMEFVRQRLPSIPLPRVYAYESAGSALAAIAGAPYMLIEGFYGNILQDIGWAMYDEPASVQEHIMTQWTRVQAELATLCFSQIGSISALSDAGVPTIGGLTAAQNAGEIKAPGPFSTAAEYFTAIADAAIERLDQSAKLGARVFRDIVQTTALFSDGDQPAGPRFPLQHGDLGAQNILVDDDFNFVAIIDWEFAHTAPWQINYYPMPFPLMKLSLDDILNDPDHIAHENVVKRHFTRNLYNKMFREAESVLEKQGRPLRGSFADVLETPASKIYRFFTYLGRAPSQDATFLRNMATLAFGLEGEGLEEYVHGVEREGLEEDARGVEKSS